MICHCDIHHTETTRLRFFFLKEALAEAASRRALHLLQSTVSVCLEVEASMGREISTALIDTYNEEVYYHHISSGTDTAAPGVLLRTSRAMAVKPQW